MPNYTFRDKNTDEIHTKQMSMSERQEYIDTNKHLEQILLPTQYVSAEKLGLVKPSHVFSDRLKEIEKSHLHSNINTWR